MLYLHNANQLITVSGHSDSPARKEQMQDLKMIENGSLLISDGIIFDLGTDEELRKKYPDLIENAEKINARNKIITPGLIEPHTHLVYAGSRENEYVMRLKGNSYMDIMNAGGGIHATTRATQRASFQQLYKETKSRLDTFLKQGVTTVEIKSGYGLTLEHELKQLNVSKKLNEDHPIDIVSTFMGAHAIPTNYKNTPDDFVEIVVEEMIPTVAELGLAEFNDVFCEKGVFTPEQSRLILEAGKRYGLSPKIHADEIEPYGGAEIAAEVGAISAPNKTNNISLLLDE